MKSSPSVITPIPTPPKTTPNELKSTSKNSRSIKLEEKDRKEEKSDDTTTVGSEGLTIYDSVIKMEFSSKKMMVSPDTPLQVSMKCLAKNKQELIVQLDSFLFVIMNPRAFRGTKSQIYCLMQPGETLNFQIGMMKETGLGVHESDLPAMKKPEGKLTVFHQVTSKKDDSDRTWFDLAEGSYDVFRCSTLFWLPGPRSMKISAQARDNPNTYERWQENGRIVKIEVNKTVEHGILGHEMFLEQETEETKKRRVQFEEILMKVEREMKKKKEEKKKGCKCAIL